MIKINKYKMLIFQVKRLKLKNKNKYNHKIYLIIMNCRAININ